MNYLWIFASLTRLLKIIQRITEFVLQNLFLLYNFVFETGSVKFSALDELFEAICCEDIDAVIVFRKIVYATWTGPIVWLYGVTLEETTG